jgi:hypothetical protein
MPLGKRRKRLPISNFVDRAMGAIRFRSVITSGGLPLQPQVNRVATQLKDLCRFTFAHAVQLNRVNHFLP